VDDTIVVIAIEDDGKGIPEREREHMFKRFVQGSNSTSGSGLGLSIAKGFAERIGGTISAGSATPPLNGARIEIRLPMATS
jgi:signal transduction histidine kinase